MEVEWDDGVVFLEVENRVPCIHPFYAWFGVQYRHAGVEFHSHPCFCPQEVYPCQEAVGLVELWQQRTQAVAEG